MAWDSVPWFVGGGAEHSPEVARLLPYVLSGGAEGVSEPGDLKVAPLAVPGSSVRVLPGSCLVRSRATGGAQQTYVGRVVSEDVVGIAATDSSGPRSDLIVARVEDPFLAGEPWAEPADPAAGPYIFTRVISNVPAGTTRLQDVPGHEGESGIALARVDLPASTGTVTDAIVVDLRRLARPRAERYTVAGVAPSGESVTGTTYVPFPTYAPSVDVPEWATHAQVTATITGIQNQGAAAGDVTVSIGSETSSAVPYSVTDTGDRSTIVVTYGGDVSALAGTTQTLRTRARRTSGPGYLTTATGTQVLFDVQFSERPS